MNEVEAIRRARQGDDEAWLVLVRKHETALFRLAYLLLGDADEAEDVAQSALIRAYHSFAQFDVARPLLPWLLQIVRNQARNRRRSMRRYVAAVTRWWQQTGAAVVQPDPAASLDAELLRQAVQQLSQGDQEVIYLRYFLELSVAETAATLAVAEGTVKSRASRALERLRTCIESDFPSLCEGYLFPPHAEKISDQVAEPEYGKE